jgi:hypothetical protein
MDFFHERFLSPEDLENSGRTLNGNHFLLNRRVPAPGVGGRRKAATGGS